MYHPGLSNSMLVPPQTPCACPFPKHVVAFPKVTLQVSVVSGHLRVCASPLSVQLQLHPLEGTFACMLECSNTTFIVRRLAGSPAAHDHFACG